MSGTVLTEGKPESPKAKRGRDIRRWRNRALLLRELQRRKRTSRRGLHEATGIRPNTVGEIVSELIDEGLVHELGPANGSSGRGRRRREVELAPDAQVLGMELYEGMIRVGALSLRGDASEVVEHPLRSHDRSAVVGEILESIRPLMRRRHVHGLGVALAGIVDSRRGISRRIAHFEGWRDVPLSRELESAVGVPVRLGNLTEVRLVDLKSRGVIGPGMTAALVVLEPGAIGCGIVAEGQLLRGAVESSSELGQTIVQMGDQQLRLEELTEWPRLRDQVTRRGGEAPASAMAFFRSGDAVAAEVRLALTRHLGIALANLVFLIKPARLLLTGSLTEHRETFIDPLCAGLRSHLLPSFDEALTIEVLPQTPGEGVRCAASLALERLFAVPEVRSV